MVCRASCQISVLSNMYGGVYKEHYHHCPWRSHISLCSFPLMGTFLNLRDIFQSTGQLSGLPLRQPPNCSPTRSTRTFHIMIIIMITIIIIILLLLHQPQRLLEHQKIAFQHLGPILHMANLIDTFGRPIELPLPFRALFSESRRLFLELGFLLGNGGGVGV